jgi:branched-chain amino acid transport system ATP-binding protein
MSARVAALQADGVSAGYGPQAVIHDVDLAVYPGEVVGLLGANGAGKTTTLLTLAGELPTLSGRVLMDGTATAAPLYRRARQGLTFVTEEKSVFMGLSARDNLRVADVDIDAALELFPELEKLLGVRAGLLSGGEQQMLTLARALSRRPRVLLADELSMGLAPLIVKRLLDAVVRAAKEMSTAVLLVEQHVRKALEHCDRAYVMHRGRIALSGTTGEMMDQITEIEDHYLTTAAASDGAAAVQ